MKSICLIFVFLLINEYYAINVGDKVKLPNPVTEGGMPLFEALTKRESLRVFDPDKRVNSQIISQALWTCYGVNRKDSKLRTTPSAKGWFPLLVYVFLEDGVYLYDSIEHSLTKKFEGDFRYLTGTQTDLVNNARINFVFVADFKKPSAMDPDEQHKLRSIYLDTGHCAMALSLYAASNNMKGVDRAMVEPDPLLEFLGLPKDDYIFTLAFSLGF